MSPDHRQCTALSADPLQIYADRFSGHYAVMTFGSLSGAFTGVSKGFSVKYDNNSVVATNQ